MSTVTRCLGGSFYVITVISFPISRSRGDDPLASCQRVAWRWRVQLQGRSMGRRRAVHDFYDLGAWKALFRLSYMLEKVNLA